MRRLKGSQNQVNIIAKKILTTILILTASTILSINAIKSIKAGINMIKIYSTRRVQVEQLYLKLIEKQLELKYVTSDLYAEEQLRNSLNYYKRGEKVIIFTEPIPEIKNTTTQKTKAPRDLWAKIILF